ncbi:hypothetical protein V2J09_012370 [Rumex salicifolius]
MADSTLNFGSVALLAHLGGGGGVGNNGLWRRLPFGTLMANVYAACLMAALATLKKAVSTEASVTVEWHSTRFLGVFEHGFDYDVGVQRDGSEQLSLEGICLCIHYNWSLLWTGDIDLLCTSMVSRI